MYLILATANAALDWNAILGLLASSGRIHFVGAVLELVSMPVMALLLVRSQSRLLRPARARRSTPCSALPGTMRQRLKSVTSR